MYEEIVGSSEALRRVLAQVGKVAPSNSTVLILGETGTGKELIAGAIHKRSRRSNRPFIRVNCAAIPPSLIASELFGHEKGAFTGALQRRLGRFESVDGGTIFLDEIGDLPPEMQISLLRVLVAEAQASIARFLEKVYNEKRLHSALGYRPPVEFEPTLLVSSGAEAGSGSAHTARPGVEKAVRATVRRR